MTKKEQWKFFSNGCWQNSYPTVPGLYPTCTFDGFVVEAKQHTENHYGFWWSKQYPDIPEFSLDMLNNWLFRNKFLY